MFMVKYGTCIGKYYTIHGSYGLVKMDGVGQKFEKIDIFEV